MIVVQAEEQNMYDQHFVSAVLTEKYPFLISYNELQYKGKMFILFPYSQSRLFYLHNLGY